MAAMMMMYGLLICSSILVLYIEATTMTSVETSANSYFQSVDPERRDALVMHYLTEALERVNVQVNPDPRVQNPIIEFGAPPINFSENLLAWTRSETNLSYAQIGHKVENGNINTNRDSCRYPPDVGCLCCPF